MIRRCAGLVVLAVAAVVHDQPAHDRDGAGAGAGAASAYAVSRWWPLADLRLSTRDVELRPTVEADLDVLSAILPADLEQNPASYRFAFSDEQSERAAVLHQEYWHALSSWRPEEWTLPFTARQGGEIVGQQWLEGSDFPRLRTVDSASWLVVERRGRGFGRQLRAAVLALAFGPLGAGHAVTSAWPDNAGSLGVSRSLGYRPNGVSALWRADADGGQRDHLEHYRLTRADWLAAGHAEGITVEGAEACLPYFGLVADEASN